MMFVHGDANKGAGLWAPLGPGLWAPLGPGLWAPLGPGQMQMTCPDTEQILNREVG